jgi:ubiquinone/menaquinone biosynthesis C-methylase UbiE
MDQKKIFKKSEGNSWFHRNASLLDKDSDLILDIIKKIELRPKKVLEIGCSNGSRLSKIHTEINADCYGIDPSKDAIVDGEKKYKNIKISVGTADILNFKDDTFDCVIFGFCLYLCDRADLFKIAQEADRVLKDKGSMMILDFFPPVPYKNPYSHYKNIHSYKMDYSKMFLWNPSYSIIHTEVFTHSGYKKIDIPDERVSLTVLSKNISVAYPVSIYDK